MDTRLCSDQHLIANFRMIFDAHLACHDHIVAGFTTACQSDLPANHVMTTDLIVVTNHDQIVDLCAFADRGGLKRPTVDGAIGPNLDIVGNLNRAGLRDLIMATVFETISKPIAADHRTGVNLDPISQNGFVI